jgi:translation elongation factor EF-G
VVKKLRRRHPRIMEDRSVRVGVFATGVNAMDPALIFLDITPRTSVDQQKLARALQVLAEESIACSPDVDRDCIVIGATSEAHLEEIVDRLKREFDVEASVGRPDRRISGNSGGQPRAARGT